MPFVKMTGKCAGGPAGQLKGETSVNMHCMLMLYSEAVDESKGRATLSPLRM